MLKPLRHAFGLAATIGAVAPSSRQLARAMAFEAGSAELMVELGAGTGPITQALSTAYPQTPLVCVELRTAQAARLRARFPSATVIARPAAAVLRSLVDAPALTVVVSALPFRSLPVDVGFDTTTAIAEFLLRHRQRRLVQFTYQPRAPFSASPWPDLVWKHRRIVWRNVPPAGVWTLTHREAA